MDIYSSFEELLLQWNLSELIETFQKNIITPSQVLLLTDELIKELIPEIGLRISFLQKVTEAKALQQMEVVFTSESSTSDVPISSDESAESCDQIHAIPEQHRQIAFIGIENFHQKSTFPDFDLRTLLITTPLGKSILQYYESKQQLDHTRRSRLVDIIMKHIYSFILKYHLKHEDYNIITAKILSVFPTENSSTYYVASIPKSKSITGKSILARGKFVDECRNLLYQSGEGPSKKRKVNVPEENLNKTALCLLDDAMKADIEWLNYRREPWAEVLTKWSKTYDVRKTEISLHRTENMIDKLLKKWPILSDSRALDLNNWSESFKVILECKTYVRDPVAMVLLQELINNEGKLANDSVTAIQIYLLPHLIPPKGRIYQNGKPWKFNIQEAVNSMIVQVEKMEDIDKVIEEVKTKAALRKLGVQPFLLVHGPSLQEIEHSYVVIDSNKYQVVGCLKALDCCFKVFHVLNGQYPPPAQHIWTLIQQGIYKIHTDFDKTFPYISDIISKLAQPCTVHN